MADIFSTPIYEDWWAREFEFAQYGGERSIFWLKLRYFILRDKFASRLGQPLDFAQTAQNGKKIFRELDAATAAKLQSLDYRVIDEHVEPSNALEDIYEVVELYGYAPARSFNLYSAEVVQFPALRDTSAGGKAEASITLNYSLGQLMFYDEKKLFSVGDQLAFFINQEQRGVGWVLYSAYAKQLSTVNEIRIEKVITKTENGVPTEWAMMSRCYCTDVGWRVPTTNADESSQSLITSYSGWRRAVVQRGFSMRSAFGLQMPITEEITYHTTFPDMSGKLRIMAGQNEVQEVNSSTTPNLATWNAWKAAKTPVCLLEPEITQIGTIYKRTLKKCECR